MGGLKVVVCEDLWKRIQGCKDVFRTLYGFVAQDGVHNLTGCTLLRESFPYGHPALGVFASDPEADAHSLISNCEKRLQCIREALDALDLPNLVLLTTKANGSPSARLVAKDALYEETAICELADLSSTQGVVLRTRLSVPLSVEYTGAEGQFRGDVKHAISTSCRWLAPSCVTFELREQFMKGQEQVTLGEFLRKVLGRKSEPDGMDKQEVNTIRLLSGEKVVSSCGCPHTPIIDVQRRRSQRFEFHLNLDVISFTVYSLSVEHVTTLLTRSLHQQAFSSIEAICSSVVYGNQLIPPTPMHFQAGGARSFATVLFPANRVLPACRLALHADLLLSNDKGPLFSLGQHIYFAKDSPIYSKLLVNPHAKVKPPARADRVAIVRGNYLYFHYMQEKFDDSGWGCAYRSLQTLSSWFLLQGYTDVKIPNHKKIQETLVEIGDKESSFIGSKQWIGSQEVSFVLNQLMKIDSKIISVPSGSELPFKAQNLITHFETHGTPVMIGGGQLAHTILGVAVNSETEETHFLILDPHYTGTEDMHTITAKGWCSWKPSTFWDKASFYNMCLPQVSRYTL
ncbi:ufm1-specific protease 2-like isoform X1 [Varroa jacobsoni]|uniref:ufm1-specific protease 2-like isoform X1 n=2 Tax=Varroa jacobsoni TaxID=62625 RepID=UPI000BF51FBA|nr:ufm1-specific protease 2-like isoform X1 [Varroa jacobsoni]